MFLTEGTKLNTVPAISASPTTGWQMLYESEMAWHKLEMGMTRLEHSAIVREDHSLLQEGVKEFFSKAKKWFQWAGQEFLRYLDKVIDTWVNIQNKIRTWLMNVDDLKKKVNNKGIKIKASYLAVLGKAKTIANSADKIKEFVDKARDDAEKNKSDEATMYQDEKDTKNLMANKGIAQTFAGVPGLADLLSAPASETGFGANSNMYKDAEAKELTPDVLTEAINFAKDGRVKCIKTLQYARNSFAKIINMGIRNADAESENVKAIKRQSSKVREVLNKWISLINKATNAVISAIGKSTKEAKPEFKWF